MKYVTLLVMVSFMAGCDGCRERTAEKVAQNVIEQAVQHAPLASGPGGAAAELVAPRGAKAPTTHSGRAAEAPAAPRTTLFPYVTLVHAEVAAGPNSGGVSELLFRRTDESFDQVVFGFRPKSEPYEAYRSELQSPLPIATHGGAIFMRMTANLADSRGSATAALPAAPLVRVRLGEDPPAEPQEILADTSSQERFGFAGDWAYVSTGGGFTVDAGPSSIFARHEKTGEKIVVRGPEPNTVADLQIHNGDLYWTSIDRAKRALDYPPSEVFRYALDADGRPSGQPPESIYGSPDRPEDIEECDGSLYFLTTGSKAGALMDGTLVRWDPAQRAMTVVVRDLSLPDHLVSVAGHLCWRQGDWDRSQIACYAPKADRLLLVADGDDATMFFGPARFGDSVIWSEWNLSDSDASGTFSISLRTN